MIFARCPPLLYLPVKHTNEFVLKEFHMKRLVLIFTLFSLMFTVGCQKVYYAAMEEVGYEKQIGRASCRERV